MNIEQYVNKKGGINKLTDKERGNIWKLIDSWYNNMDAYDLMEISGVFEILASKIKK